MDEDKLIFEYGQIRFEIHESNVEDDCDPPLSASDQVVGLHTAANTDRFPTNANSDLAIIFGEQDGATIPKITTPDSFRSLMTCMLVADYLAPWVNEERMNGVFKSACTLIVNLIYDTGLLKDYTEEEKEQTTTNGKRAKRKVNYAESTSGDDDSGSIFTMDSEQPTKKPRLSEEAAQDTNSESSDSDEDSTAESTQSLESEESLADEKDLYLFTHERMRGFAIAELDTAKQKVEWKAVFTEWWDKCFEKRLIDNPELYDLIWPRIERINYDLNPHRRKKVNDIDLYIADGMQGLMKEVKFSTKDKLPLKATRSSCTVSLEYSGYNPTYFFHSGFTQPRPLQKRGKVNDNGQHSIVKLGKRSVNPVVLRVNGAGIFHAIKKMVKADIDVDLELDKIQFSNGWDKHHSRGWLKDVLSMEVCPESRDIVLKYVPDEPRFEYMNLLLSIHSRVIGGLTDWENATTSVNQQVVHISDYAKYKEKFIKVSYGVHPLYHAGLAKEQNAKLFELQDTRHAFVFNTLFHYSHAVDAYNSLKEHTDFDALDHSKPEYERMRYTPPGAQEEMHKLARIFDMLSGKEPPGKFALECTNKTISFTREEIMKMENNENLIMAIGSGLKYRLRYAEFARCWEHKKDGTKFYPRKSKKFNTNVIRLIIGMDKLVKEVNEMMH